MFNILLFIKSFYEATSSLGPWAQAYVIIAIMSMIVYIVNEMIPAGIWVHSVLRGGNIVSFPPFLRYFMPATKPKEGQPADAFVPPTVFIRPMVFGWYACLLVVNTGIAVVCGIFWPITLQVSLIPIFKDAYLRAFPK